MLKKNMSTIVILVVAFLLIILVIIISNDRVKKIDAKTAPAKVL